MAGEWSYSEGISLRDYFAAKAMAGALAMPWYPEMGVDWRQSICDRADFAYQQADAMLEARAKTKGDR